MHKKFRFFYAPDGAQGGAEGATGTGAEGTGTTPEGTGAGTGNQPPEEGAGEKTFTQAELSAVAATEKKQGKQAILNLFGLKDEKTAKTQAEEFKKWQESQKDTEQKLKDSQAAVSEAEERALAAEAKLACVEAGVDKDSIDDILAIAAQKVTDDKGLDAVLEEMKKEPRYAGFFKTASSGSKGTGNPATPNGKGGSSTDNIGARLGKKLASEPKKSNYFSN